METIFFFDKQENKLINIFTVINPNETEQEIKTFFQKKYNQELIKIDKLKRDLLDINIKEGTFLLKDNSIYEKKKLLVKVMFGMEQVLKLLKKEKFLLNIKKMI